MQQSTEKSEIRPLEKVITFENFGWNISTHDFIGHINIAPKLLEWGLLFPNGRNVPHYVTFSRLSFFSITCPSQTAGQIFTLYNSNVFLHKEGPFGGPMGDVIGDNAPFVH